MAKKPRTLNQRGIVVDIIPSDIDYRIITVPVEYRDFFPGYKVRFDLERDNAETGAAWMTSGDGDLRKGDTEAGRYICGGLREWYENNSVRVGDQARISKLDKIITEGRVAYRLTHIPQGRRR